MELEVNGINVYYEEHGPETATPVVFIHGFPFNSEMWKPQVEALQSTYRVIVYDIRGHGKSSVSDGQYSIEYFVDDLFALLDHITIKKVVLVGLSMGGYIALRAIEREPGRVRAIVLCDTKSDADTNETKIRRANQAKAIKANGTKGFADDFVHAVFFEKTFQFNPGAVQSIHAMIENMSPLAIAGASLAMASRTDTTSSLGRISVPAMIMVGENDTLTPPHSAMQMKEKMPNAEMYIIPNAAHVSNLENPKDFNNRLLTFLQKLK
ncbi:MAG: alpha/beta fold hydrolase [Bacteroidota bacterium]